jgi:uncharacterized phage protein gp47/JayE
VLGGTVWRWLGAGDGAADVLAQTIEAGPNLAPSGTINLIKTPVAGWANVTNVSDAEPGRGVEPDESLRLRRVAELAGAGSHSINALRADLLRYLDTTGSVTQQVTIFQNVTDAVDAAGLPPHTVECLIRGGVDLEIALLLLDAVGVCYATHGNVTNTVQDAQGFDHVVKFSRPTPINIWADVSVTKDPTEYPIDGNDRIKALIVAYGDAQKTGRDAVGSALAAQCFQVPGVLDCVVTVGISPAPVGLSYVIALRELAVYDTARIAITTYDSVP